MAIKTIDARCCCGTILAASAPFVQEDAHGEMREHDMNIYYKRCPIHEKDSPGSYFLDTDRDFQQGGLRFTREGLRMYHEMYQRAIDNLKRGFIEQDKRRIREIYRRLNALEKMPKEQRTILNADGSVAWIEDAYTDIVRHERFELRAELQKLRERN